MYDLPGLFALVFRNLCHGVLLALAGVDSLLGEDALTLLLPLGLLAGDLELSLTLCRF